MARSILIRGLGRAEVLDQPGGCLRGALRQATERFNLLRSEVSTVDTITKGIEDLLELTVGSPKVATEVGGQVSTESFRDEARCRARRSLKLSTQIVVVKNRPDSDQGIDTELQLVGPLPHDEVFMRSRCSHAVSECTACAERGLNLNEPLTH